MRDEREASTAGDTWRVRVDQSRCVGSTICTHTAVGAFEVGDEGLSQPTAESVAPDDRVLRAAELCPLEAISITRADTGEELFPGTRLPERPAR